ncbi:MAG TPA: vWA domain-containing protein [Terriglobales bacterium]|nr:vWA domain-containing protein [Terriglobales bacterium]
MSHIVGTVQVLGTPMTIGAGTTVFNPAPAPGGTKFLILHFQNLNFNPGDQLAVDLGYDTDIFTAADGPDFWTRPINVYAFPAGVSITYTGTGNVQLDQYGRGERHLGEPSQPMPSFSNCDPFYQPSAYVEPQYDPFWFCTFPPNWENATSTTPATDVRAKIVASTGMIVTVENSETTGIKQVSTCSITLVDFDKVISAGHCHTPTEALTASVTFDYETDASGNRPAGYNPRFYKVKAVLGQKNVNTNLDYSLLQLAEVPAGVPVIQMRPNFPAVGEQVFGLHHPNGAVKKLSIPHGQGFATVTGSGSSGIFVSSNVSVSGGSSGSGLFDMAGRIVGVLSRGAPCSGSPLGYCPTVNILADLAPAPPPPITRDVMLVADRSGSMSSDDGSGRTKIEAARDAISLFVQLVRASTGNRAGLVSFSTTASSPVDFAIAPVTPATQTTLVGGPPFSGGIVGGLAPGGATSIGGGLAAAQGQFPAPGANPRAILLLTDGLQNTSPMIADVDGSLSGITVHAIGLGSESNLDGALLTSLTAAHGGLYTRASGGLSLEKFFSSAFGNIFEAGVLFDPEFDLPADAPQGTPVPFSICGEEEITAVAGWDNGDASLLIEVTAPGGIIIRATTAGVRSASGRTWTFLRFALPFGGARNGQWLVNVVRPGGGGEFPPPTPELHYFVNVIPTGGPRMTRLPDPGPLYTGDRFNPLVLVRYEDGSWPEGMDVSMTATRPDGSVGTLLSKAGLGGPGTADGDALPARQAALQAIEAFTGKPVVQYVDTSFDLSDSAQHNGGMFESAGTFGKALDDFLTVEGNYTFHAKASWGDPGCPGMRELLWSSHVEIGIDPGQTTVTTTPIGGGTGGNCLQMTFTPRDKYGNMLGPGRLDAFTLVAQTGSSPSGPVTDLGNGSYQVNVCSDPDSLVPPSIGISQPGRPPAVVRPPKFNIFVYSVKFLCGVQADDCCGCAPVRPGSYSTEINIHNSGDVEVPVVMGLIPLVLAGVASGRSPNVAKVAKAEGLRLPAHSATMSDCCHLQEKILGADPGGRSALTLGIVEILTTAELNVTAVYTAGGDRGAPAIDVEQIQPRILQI